jgi:hypothetical protein
MLAAQQIKSSVDGIKLIDEKQQDLNNKELR